MNEQIENAYVTQFYKYQLGCGYVTRIHTLWFVRNFLNWNFSERQWKSFNGIFYLKTLQVALSEYRKIQGLQAFDWNPQFHNEFDCILRDKWINWPENVWYTLVAQYPPLNIQIETFQTLAAIIQLSDTPV